MKPHALLLLGVLGVLGAGCAATTTERLHLSALQTVAR